MAYTKEKSICETCNKEFSFYRSTLRGKKGRFCSRNCIQLTPWNKGKIEFKKCLSCGKQVRKWRKYCSQKCYQELNDPTDKLPKDVKGELNPFFGKKHTLETREKIYGANHWNWKGGITPENIKERMKFVQEVGQSILKRDNYSCQICGAKQDLQIDHIQKWSEYVEGRFSINNCRTLCRHCHYKITYGREMPKDSKWGKYHFRKEIFN